MFTADGLAYSALLKNELLGAGIEKVQDPQTEDRRLQPSTPERRSLFHVKIIADVTWSRYQRILDRRTNVSFCLLISALN